MAKENEDLGNDRPADTPAKDEGFEEFFGDLSESGAEEDAPDEEPEIKEDEEEAKEEEEESKDEESDEEVEDDSEEASEEEAPASKVDEEEEVDDDLEFDEDLEDAPEPDAKDDIIAQLTARLDKLENPKEEAPKEEPQAELPDDLEARIFGDLDFDDMMADKGLFLKVIKNALQVGGEVTKENILKTIPNLVTQQTRGYYELNKMNRLFYKKNKDLRGFKKTVVAAANEIHSANPELGMEQVMERAAVRARKVIGIRKGAKPDAPKAKPKQKPAFAGTPNKKKKAVKLTGLQKDLKDTLDF